MVISRKSLVVSRKLVEVVSPSSSITGFGFNKIKEILAQNGFEGRFVNQESLLLKEASNHDFPAFTAKERFLQLKKAIENSDSDIIWCARGGYGSGDLLPFLQKMPKVTQQKIFIGFSDVTSLTIFLQQEWGWKIISAPMLGQIASEGVTKKSAKVIFDLVKQKISGKKIELSYKLKALNHEVKNEISGIIVGGCISVIAGHFATSCQLDWSNKILFLEDIGESGERLDRYFRQIVCVMKEGKSYPKAILLGNFMEADSRGVQKKNNITLAIKKFTDRLRENNLNISVFEEESKCLGHARNMMPLVIGEVAKITRDKILTQSF